MRPITATCGVALKQHKCGLRVPATRRRPAQGLLSWLRKGHWTPSAASRCSNGYLMRRNKMKLRGALLAASLLALPMVASAQPVTGLYLGAGAGVNFMQDETIKSVGGFATPNNKLETNIGAVGVVSLGWGFGNGLRAEIEGDYRYNGLKQVTGPGGGSISGSEQKYGPM